MCRKTQRPLALKITQWDQESPTTAAKALLHEKKMLSEKLSHTNIIKAYDCGQEWANYLIMEMQLGVETLQSYYQRVSLTEAQCAQIMRGVFAGLEYLHDEMNVIHRDIKPENVVIMDYDDLSKVKLIDFGLAVKSTKLDLQDYAKCGTLLYTPPEQVLNNFAYAKVSNED